MFIISTLRKIFNHKTQIINNLNHLSRYEKSGSIIRIGLHQSVLFALPGWPELTRQKCLK